MEITLKEVIITFAIPIICGLLSLNSIRRLLKGKIKQFSIEYQLFGYAGMNVFVFGLIFAFGKLADFLCQ